jgi:hypothetical protein
MVMNKHRHQKPRVLTVDEQIAKMAADFAGEKLPKVLSLAQEFVNQGKSEYRALADALEKLKCPNTYPDLQ